MYYFQIVDWYAASLCVTLTSFLECVIVGWIYGNYRISQDIIILIFSNVNLVKLKYFYDFSNQRKL